MSDIIKSWAIPNLLASKQANSITYNNFLPRAPLPSFNNVFEIAAYLREKFTYKADPLLFDHYTHPQVAQWAMINNTWNINGKALSFDCDDYATWANRCLAATYGEGQTWMVNLIVNPAYFWSWPMNHVICLLFNYQFNGSPWVAVIDTNGLNWFIQQGDWAKAIMAHFGKSYNVEYVYFERVAYPFPD
jgi:hypothetical protein